MNLPDYNFLSAPLWLISVLHVVTLTVHFLAMNFIVGGIIIVLFGKFEDKWNHPTVKQFVKWFPTVTAATVTFGVAPLLFAQLAYARQVYSASIVSAWFWLDIVFAAIVAYYFLYAGAFSKRTTYSRVGTYLVIALICLVYISFIYSSVFSMAERPDLYASLYAGNQSGFLINPEVGDYILRWMHMLLGAVTVGGFFVAMIGRDNDQAFRIGKTFYLWGMMAAMVIGLAYLFTMGDRLVPFMRSPAVWFLLVSIVLSLLSLHFVFKKKFVWAAVMLGPSVLGMVAIRHVVRLLYLEGYWDPSTMPVNPQWSIFIVFLLCFVLAIGLVWYMLKLLSRGTEFSA